MFATAHDDAIRMPGQRRGDMVDQARAAPPRERLVAAEPARVTTGEDRAEDHAGRISASARTMVWSVRPACFARRTARSVAAEIVASIGQPASAAFSTNS